MTWLKYFLRRLVMAVGVLISVSIITFMIARIVPSDPAAAWVGPRPSPEQIEKARVDLGLDKPLHIQYLRYMEDLIQGDLGISIKSHQPIANDIRFYLPATLELVVVGMLVACVIGIPLGVLSGWKKGSLVDHLSRVVSVAGVAIPTFFLGMLMQLLFFSKLGLLPIGNRISIETALYHPIDQITGFYLVDTLLTGNWVAFKDSLLHIILPSFTLGVYALGLTIRMTRSTIIEVLNERYILAAQAFGLPDKSVLFILALKNAIIPTLVVLGLAFVYSLTGAILVEVVFSWPGLGKYMTAAVINVDFPVIVSVTLIITVFYVIINLFLDLIQAVIDPRVVLE